MKTEVYVTAPCLFMRWNQLRRIISGRFYRLIMRDVHPKIFFDGEYWSVFFDTLTDDEADILLCSAAMPDSPKANLYAQNEAKEFLPETVIRFITPNYEEKFRIEDGGKVKWIFRPDNEQIKVCRYIDECHFEIGTFSQLYHICQFAEMCEKFRDTVQPVDDKEEHL